MGVNISKVNNIFNVVSFEGCKNCCQDASVVWMITEGLCSCTLPETYKPKSP